jgi:hypothetical protein
MLASEQLLVDQLGQRASLVEQDVSQIGHYTLGACWSHTSVIKLLPHTVHCVTTERCNRNIQRHEKHEAISRPNMYNKREPVAQW